MGSETVFVYLCPKWMFLRWALPTFQKLFNLQILIYAINIHFGYYIIQNGQYCWVFADQNAASFNH